MRTPGIDVVIECPHHLLRGIRPIHDGAVRGEGKAIGCANTVHDGGGRTIPLDPEEVPAWKISIVVGSLIHRADPQPASGVGPAIVHANERITLQGG